jgi:WhiB family redox-sensing transcriptional regulator
MTTWLSSAACLGYDPAIWFPGQGGDVLYPKSICATCPSIEPCREHGLRHESFGIFGGLTNQERKRLRRAQGIRGVVPEAVAFVAPCGSPAAYKRHLREGKPVDDICRRAHNERQWAYKERMSQRAM